MCCTDNWKEILVGKSDDYTYYWADDTGQTWKADSDEINAALAEGRTCEWTRADIAEVLGR